MSAKAWLLVVLGVCTASCAALLAVVGPRLVKGAAGVYAPISKMKAEQQEFERWVEAHPWREPQAPELAPAELDAFLALRKELLELEAKGEGIGDQMPQDRRPGVEEISGLMQGVGGLMTGRVEAHRRHDMPPKHYDYVKRLVYRRWLEPLRAQGLDPAARLAAARELLAAAEAERDAAVRQKLRQIGRAMQERRPLAPEGIPEPLHALLFARAAEIQALAERESRFRRR